MSLKYNHIGSIEKGLRVHEETVGSVAEKKYIQYNKDDLIQYKEKFEILRDDYGVIRSTDEFNDHEWQVSGTQYYRTLKFREVEYNKDLYLSLKCFVVLQMFDGNLTPEGVSIALGVILNTVKITSCYDKRKITDFEKMKLEKLSTYDDMTYVRTSNLKFLCFYPINDANDYLPLLESIPGHDWTKIREIPTYEEFIRFDALINDFINTASIPMRAKYYPIILWWKLSTIIPIRPLEFVQIKNEHIRYDNEKEEYYFTKMVRKQQPYKKEKGDYDSAVPYEFKISKELFELIIDYRKLTNSEGKEYLFYIEHHYEYLENPNTSSVIRSGKTKKRTEHRTTDITRRLLSSFFNEVIEKEKGLKVVFSRDELDIENPHKTITLFNLMDTRHFAISSMMMQGFSELTIAQMAGHTNIQSQSPYAAHIDDFQRSYSNLLATDIRRGIANLDNSGFEHFTFRQKQLLSYTGSEFSTKREAEYGYCQSKIYPLECCEESCIFCNKLHVDLSNLTPTEYAELNEIVAKLDDAVKIKLNFIKRYYETTYNPKKLEANDVEKKHAELKQNSANLSIFLNRKAMLETHLTKNKEMQHDNREA